MNISVLRLTNRPRSRYLSGLAGFDPSGNYTTTTVTLDMQADSSVADRVNAIVSQGSVGRYNNRTVYDEAATGTVWTDVGISYPKLQELAPVDLLTPPPVGSPSAPCPCENCREEVITETYYASREQSSPDDIPVSMSRDIVICEPTDSGGVTVACADELARVKAQAGIAGLRDTWQVRNKKCIDRCKGLPEKEWNTCMDGCKTINDQQPALSSLSASAGKDCFNKCNSQHLSQAELQKCYAACPTTGRAAVNSKYSVAPSGQIVSAYQPMYRSVSGVALSGLSNDSGSVDDETPIYTTDGTSPLYLPPPVQCDNNNTLWFVIIGGACTILGYIIAQALKRR